MHEVVWQAPSKLLLPMDEIFDQRSVSSGCTVLTESGPPVALEMTVSESPLCFWCAFISSTFLGLQFVAKTRKILCNIERSTVIMWRGCSDFNELEYGHTFTEFILPA
jgi:hypothetical protein